MRHTAALVIGVCLISVSATSLANAQQVQPTTGTTGTTGTMSSTDEMLLAVRSDLQNTRAEIMAKNVSLTSAQAAKFWPMFEAYQKEQNVILDDQLKSVQWYVEHFEEADDAASLQLIKAHLERDTKMTALRQKWLGEFQGVLGTKQAVRVMQVDRRLSLMQQAFVASKIPLAH